MKLLIAAVFLLISIIGITQNEESIKITVEKETEMKNDFFLVGEWSLIDEKGYFDHLISFTSDGTFKTYGSISSKLNFSGTWNSKKDSLSLFIKELENIRLEYKIIQFSKVFVKLNCHSHGKSIYFDDNHLELKKAKLNH